MTDRELLELAAKAAGISHPGGEHSIANDGRLWDCNKMRWWNPLTDDGDALRLAVKLRIDFYTSNFNGLSERTEENAVVCHSYNPTAPTSALVSLFEPFGTDPNAATRRAIVRAAAEIGKAMP